MTQTMPDNVVVPWTASWSSEERIFVASCRWACGKPALCQPESPRVGRPLFATPHSIRQRRAMVAGLCDICGVRLGEGPVSLSTPRNSDVGPVQVEPLLHRHCAGTAVEHCPELKRRMAADTLLIREVFKYQVAIAKLTRAAVLEFTGDGNWPDGTVYGHAKIIVTRAATRDLRWLRR